MPNGGVMPSCAVCKYGEWRNSEEFSNQAKCKLYDFTVWGPLNHFCVQLQGAENDGLSRFVKNRNLKNGLMYAWFEFKYRNDDYPDIPHYHHELRVLVEIKEYAQLTLEAKEKIYHDMKRVVWDEIKAD